MVAMAAPMTCFPSGRMTNMKSGSSAMFSSPPMLRPKEACEDRPIFRSIDDIVLLSMTGIPPITTTKNMYCFEYGSTLSLAPKKRSSGVIPIRHRNENRAADASAIHKQAADTREASSLSPLPIRRAIRVPPPVP